MEDQKVAEMKLEIIKIYSQYFNDPYDLTAYCKKIFKEIFLFPR